MKRGRGRWLAWLGFVLGVVYIPVLVVIVLSFNASQFGTFPFEFTTEWYVALAGNDALMTATMRSLGLSVAVAAASAVIGTGLALWMVRHARVGSAVFTGLLTTAITIPWLILAIAVLLVAIAVGVGRGIGTLFVGSLAVALPYTVLVVVARLQGVGTQLEDAARSLGASPLAAFRLVTLPLLTRAIFSGTMLSFIITFNNFPLHFFLAPFGFNTLPMAIYTYVLSGYEPDINALAAVLMGLAIAIGVGALMITRRSAGDPSTTERLKEVFG